MGTISGGESTSYVADIISKAGTTASNAYTAADALVTYIKQYSPTVSFETADKTLIDSDIAKVRTNVGKMVSETKPDFATYTDVTISVTGDPDTVTARVSPTIYTPGTIDVVVIPDEATLPTVNAPTAVNATSTYAGSSKPTPYVPSATIALTPGTGDKPDAYSPNVGGPDGEINVTVDPATKPTVPTPDYIDASITVDESIKPNPVSLSYINTDITIGTADKPTIIGNLPDIPERPSFENLPAPDVAFEYDEAYYTSSLNDLLKQALYDELRNGSTGLTASVENDIYSREYERDILTLQNNRDKIANIWAESGMSIPDGVLISAINMAQVDFQNKYSDKSRDIRIESFKRADDNAKFIKDLSVKYEQILMDYSDKYWGRKLDAAKSILIWAQTYYEMWIKYESIFLERYKTDASVYQAVANAESAILESQAKVYDSEVRYVIGAAEMEAKEIEAKVEVEKLKIQNGGLDVQIYEAEIKEHIGIADVDVKVVGAKIDVEKLKLSGGELETRIYDVESRENLGTADVELKLIDAKINIEKLKLSKSEIDSRIYDIESREFMTKAEIAAKVLELTLELEKLKLSKSEIEARIYETQVRESLGKGELDYKGKDVGLENEKLKLQKGEIDSKLYDSEIRENLGIVDAKIKVIEAKIDKEKLWLEKSNMDVKLYEVEAKVDESEADIKLREISAKLENEKLSMMESQTNAQVYDSIVKGYAMEADVYTKTIGTMIDNLKNKIAYASTILDSLSKIGATVASGALSAISAHGSAGSTDSSDLTRGEQTSSLSVNHNYTYKSD